MALWLHHSHTHTHTESFKHTLGPSSCTPVYDKMHGYIWYTQKMEFSKTQRINWICLKYFIILFKIQQVYFFVSNVYVLFLNDEIKGSDSCLQAVFTNDTCESGLALFAIHKKPSCLLFFSFF